MCIVNNYMDTLEGNIPWEKQVSDRQKELVNKQNTHSYEHHFKVMGESKEYMIHDNGFRPFKVVTDNKKILVYKQDIDEEDTDEEYPRRNPFSK